MKVGDLVRYRGWAKNSDGPFAIVISQRHSESTFHHRVRVVWVGDNIPVQASVISTTGSRVSSWVSPKYFEIVKNIDRSD